MSQVSNAVIFWFNITFILGGIIGLGIFFRKNKGECHRFLAIFLGSYLTQIFFLSLLYHVTSRDKKVYDENRKAGKVVGTIFWIMFFLNLIVLALIIWKIVEIFQDTRQSANSLNVGKTGINLTIGGVRNRNSNLHYRKY